MMEATYQDHTEEERHPSKDAALEAARKAMARGAVAVKVYEAPHEFVGPGRRCHICYRKRKDALHGMRP